MRDILQRLYTWVDAVLSASYSTYFVTTNPKFSVTKLNKLPIVTIRVDSGIIDDVAYGRKMPSDGSVVSYPFTLHVHAKYNTTSGEDHNLDAQKCATRIINYLLSKDQDATEMADHGIYRVRDVSGRESDLVGVKNVARIIISGTIDVIREDSP